MKLGQLKCAFWEVFSGEFWYRDEGEITHATETYFREFLVALTGDEKWLYSKSEFGYKPLDDDLDIP